MPVRSTIARTLLDEVGLVELAGRDVDRHARPRRVAERDPARDLLARLLEDPAAELDDQPGPLGERDELVGADTAALGVLPAQQRLDADDVLVGQPDLGLVLEVQLVVLQSAPQVALQRDLAQHPQAHRGVEDLVLVAAGLLGAMHRRVGVAQQVLGRRRLARPNSATPMLALIEKLPSASSTGASSASCRRLARCTASSSSSRSSQSTTNASPPNRASVSLGRIAASNRGTSASSRLSPAACPKPSLTALKRSRSITNTPISSPRRVASASAPSDRAAGCGSASR